MKLLDLYTRVSETTGLEVITLESLRTAIANCLADLTSRGYKIFVEKHLSDFENNIEIKANWIRIPLPKDIRKIVYLRLFFPAGAVIATRYSLSNKRVACRYINGEFRSLMETGQGIFYTKGDYLYIEWHTSCGENLEDISLGYYKKLSMPENFPTNETYSKDELLKCEIDIRPEFEDAIVFYAAYFYYARFIKDTDKINHYLSQYKYYVEDITHELAYEDEFNEEDAVIKLVEEDE